ncbi:hypothetical protein [Pseudomonas sp. B22129]|uniref:hypothetical protein n=1 Tax=Pseudomonas sp. B22129 TaxID=3235111 RepID=UPI003782E11C
MFDPFMLQLCQLFALRPSLQSLGITQTLLDQHYQGVLEHYCEHLIDFFTGADTRTSSRWRHLAQQLERRMRTARRALNTASAREMVKAVLDYPDSGEREQQLGERSPQVYLTARYGCLALAISRGNDIPLVFTLARGLETEDRATALPASAERLEHNVFEEWALGALEGALQRIAWVDPGAFPTLAALDRQLAWASGFVDFLEPSVEQDTLRFELEQQLPPWLKNAAPSGRLAYSQWLEALARFHEKSRGVSDVDDDVQAGQALFARQLALQLRRLTLECSLRNESHVTHEGYRTMRAAVNTFALHRRLRGVPMGFMPLLDGSGYLLGPPTNSQGPWLVVRPEAQPMVEQVTLAPNAGPPLEDPFSVLYHAGVARWRVLFEHPLHTLARLKQVGGNLQGTCEAGGSWRCEVSLLRNLALLLVYPGTQHPGDVPGAHARVKRMDSAWAGARKALSEAQGKGLAALQRPPSSALGELIGEGVHKGLHRLGGALIYNKDENRFNVLSNIRIAPVVNVTLVEHQIVDNHDQPTAYGPGIAPDTRGRWKLQRAPRLRRDINQPSPAARRAINAGAALRATLPVLLGEATRLSRVPGTLAVEVEEDLERNARLFDDAARAIQRASAHSPLISLLRGEAGQLRAHGRYLRIEMVRHTLTPTLGDVQYLLEQQVICIRRVAGRVPETIDGVVDYLQEYEVLDLTEGERPLWYAHFHYSSAEAADEQPKAAHLKTAAQRRLGREYERETGHKVYRGPITNASGRQIFLAH